MSGKPSFVTPTFRNTKIIHFCNNFFLLQKWMIFVLPKLSVTKGDVLQMSDDHPTFGGQVQVFEDPTLNPSYPRIPGVHLTFDPLFECLILIFIGFF